MPVKLYVLCEKSALDTFKAEFGLSYLIEFNHQQVLFDTGHTDIFMKNAGKMGLDLERVQDIVLSHGHWDHGNGLKHLINKRLICHPRVFMPRFKKKDGTYVGLDSTCQELKKRFSIMQTKEPFFLSENILFLGEIPRVHAFEALPAAFKDQNGENDPITDDSALVIIQDNELIIVSGCAHSGICNTVRYAREVSGIRAVSAIIGGFHLKSNNLQVRRTIEYLKENHITRILPTHCTADSVISAFTDEFEVSPVKSGMTFDF
jgi:7,8-dihydropterin-6-yl-methyl-4-(beta-D-ribofuranosyl)aminobenzene 5'-phosphate synthase